MIEINLIPEELRAKGKGKKAVFGFRLEDKYFLYLIPLTAATLILAHLCLAAVNIIRIGQYQVLNKKWRRLEPQRNRLEEFNKELAILSQDTSATQYLTQQRIAWAQKLNKLSLELPSGIWFRELSLTPHELILQASAVSLQEGEMNLVKKLIDNLKNDTDFFKDFNSIELTSIQKRVVGSYEIADFVLVFTIKTK